MYKFFETTIRNCMQLHSRKSKIVHFYISSKQFLTIFFCLQFTAKRHYPSTRSFNAYFAPNCWKMFPSCKFTSSQSCTRTELNSAKQFSKSKTTGALSFIQICNAHWQITRSMIHLTNNLILLLE